MAAVLVVEDDPTVSEVVLSYLERAGHTAHGCSDGTRAAELLSGPDAGAIDLVVLDLMLPGLDGLEVCRRLRRSHPDLPVIMLTALGEEDDRIAGLEVGADDYVTKPFSPRELVLRVDSVLRRSAPAAASDPAPAILSIDDLVVDTAAHRVTKKGVELNLTVRELELLAFLMRNAGTAFTRSQLMEAVWGWTFGDQSTVTVHVRRVREKIENDPQKPTLIQTVWGVGYRMDAPDAA
ncbi:response regulator transcription factor [Jatrophihabitans telluris]|uniref:Response regulator transcription factor n=1 Tax=Jatrophihabitans telluris TaxID=2038343 RepID=A0ABY4QW84_9ACTN|nr:response regulator transcription factor [Jatrophihabitans telluris]UQX87775.1 response regulator transcription factor [Jatrophihabitans telluris]